MKVTKVLGSSLVAGALFFSGVAQAATCSADALPTATASETTRSSVYAQEDGGLGGSGIIIGIVAAAAIIAGIVIAADGSDEADSPG